MVYNSNSRYLIFINSLISSANYGDIGAVWISEELSNSNSSISILVKVIFLNTNTRDRFILILGTRVTDSINRSLISMNIQF